MYIKSFLLISSFIINLGTAGGLYSDEIKTEVNVKTVSSLLNDYYNEYKEPVTVDTQSDSEQENSKKQDTLANYYSKYLK